MTLRRSPRSPARSTARSPLERIGSSAAAAEVFRFASAANRVLITTQGTSAAAPLISNMISRTPFVIGSGDFSKLRLSFQCWRIQNSVGITLHGNAYTVTAAYIEYNGVSVQVLFSGAGTKVVGAGLGDVQSDNILPASFSVANFARGTSGWIRLDVSVATPGTDTWPACAVGLQGLRYDPSKVNFTTGVSGTGVIAYGMINGGVNGTDILNTSNGPIPMLIGVFASGDPPTVGFIGDSKTAGTGDTTTLMNVQGYGRAAVPSPTVNGTGAIAGANFGCPSGVAADWAGGTPARVTAMLPYARYWVEAYGTNAQNAAASQAIHALIRAANAKIIRTSLTSRATSSSDSYATETNQVVAAGWSNGGAVDTFEIAMKALVASDLTHYEFNAARASVQAGSRWLWNYDGTAFKYTGDGLHENAFGYEAEVNDGTYNMVTTPGPTTTAQSLRALLASLT